MRGISGRRSRRCDLKELFIITNSGSEPVMRVRGLLRSLNYDGRLGLILAGSCVLLLLASLAGEARDRKSTRLNSSHRCISYAVFCLKKKKKNRHDKTRRNLRYDSDLVEYALNDTPT